MTAKAQVLRFAAPALLPEERGANWAFLHVPKAASLKLPTRGQVAVAGTLNGIAFRGVLEPDGSKGHWLKIATTLRRKAGVKPGEDVAVAVSLSDHEPLAPGDLRRALADSPRAQAAWKAITPAARRDWVHWITSARQDATRARRIASACDMLAGGKRRVCCFDRSGAYSRSLAAPRARS